MRYAGKELELVVGAAGAAAALLVLVLCLVAIFYCFYRRKSKSLCFSNIEGK